MHDLTVTPLEVVKVTDDVLQDLAEWMRSGERLSALGHFRPDAWLTLLKSKPDHYLLYAQCQPTPPDSRILGLVVCHADEEDFIADDVVLSPQGLDNTAPYEMMRALARMALACGCGAVVLRLGRATDNSAIGNFYRSLGGVVETLPTGEQEFAFASQAMEWLLDQAARLQRRLLP